MLSVDPSGPQPEAYATKSKYMLVAVFKAEHDSRTHSFVNGFTAQSTHEVGNSLNAILAELNALMGEQLAVRLHSDA